MLGKEDRETSIGIDKRRDMIGKGKEKKEGKKIA